MTAASLRPVSVSESHDQHALAHVECHTSSSDTSSQVALGGGPLAELRPADGSDTQGVEIRYVLQVTLSKRTEEKIRYAQALLSHAIPNGDVAQVLDRALDRLIVELEKRKVGARDGRARGQRLSQRERHIPAEVRRTVWERDGGQCTFVSTTGVRCGSRRLVEFDHVDPVARGGEATVDGIRLRCRTHNQYEADECSGRVSWRGSVRSPSARGSIAKPPPRGTPPKQRSMNRHKTFLLLCARWD